MLVPIPKFPEISEFPFTDSLLAGVLVPIPKFPEISEFPLTDSLLTGVVVPIPKFPEISEFPLTDSLLAGVIVPIPMLVPLSNNIPLVNAVPFHLGILLLVSVPSVIVVLALTQLALPLKSDFKIKPLAPFVICRFIVLVVPKTSNFELEMKYQSLYFHLK
ncbi:MAG: hypothetical protein IPL23_22830 [Saprospiraceae bacterium]|nr:hypothetical protein [Saprospiraceae bacterium]